jgi:hypothetical protein
MNSPISILEVARRADLFFMDASPIHEAMRRLAKVFREMQIPFAIAGAMAANAHGHRRTTADVIQLIRVNHLAKDYHSQLNPYVAVKFEELWQAAQATEDY